MICIALFAYAPANSNVTSNGYVFFQTFIGGSCSSLPADHPFASGFRRASPNGKALHWQLMRPLRLATTKPQRNTQTNTQSKRLCMFVRSLLRKIILFLFCFFILLPNPLLM